MAIFSTLCCCIPLGIVSIVYACKVSTLERVGDIEGAKNASNSARKWACIAIGIGLVGTIISIIINVLLEAAASANGGY